MIQNQTFLAFPVICLINIVTDVLSDYASGLRMPILQHNLDKDDLFEPIHLLNLSRICQVSLVNPLASGC